MSDGDESPNGLAAIDDWTRLDPRELAGVDMSEVPDEALPTDRRCPRCHWPVFQITMNGPTTQVLGPCGCRVAVDF
ncbi:hypothetical protein C479_06846 [Halovivax asiaticus JCM 14624]|uniref:Uncharacterized protein n=1 Tax=Halovivax asiaticus JCM 14624 TaxID=1227490 RepID=M0BL06_9EURY|nr:hypothetical protein [Halovivax asiaticus]ELZ11561.1 hypothetical protein C479_06846 [Halovivax asiaticus JCM 14624]